MRRRRRDHHDHDIDIEHDIDHDDHHRRGGRFDRLQHRGDDTAATTSSTSSGAGGAGGAIGALCKDFCMCEGCTSNDLEDCEKATGDMQQQATGAGCASEFAAYLSCAVEGIHCKGGKVVVIGCEAQVDALEACGNDGGVPFVNECEKATGWLAFCLEVGTGTGTGGGNPPTCEGTTLCSAKCINAADCEAIKDAFSGMAGEKSEAFLDCTTACANNGP